MMMQGAGYKRAIPLFIWLLDENVDEEAAVFKRPEYFVPCEFTGFPSPETGPDGLTFVG